MKFIYENFDLLFDKAGSVEAFKKLILEMAVRGKLVPQDPNDEPASELLEKIQKEKDRLIEEGVFKKEKLLPPVKQDEVPFDLPNGWLWSRLGTIATYGQNRSIKPDTIGKNAWILELEDIEKNSSKLLKRIFAYQRNSKSAKNYFNEGDVLYGKLRPYLNKVIVADQEGYSSSEIIPIKTHSLISPKYLMYSLRQESFFKYINSCTYGTKMPRLGTEDARKALISVPPLSEQKRIVNKIDEVFGMIPKFQEALEQRENYKRRLNQVSLSKLANTRNRDEFVKSVQFVVSNFDSLYDTPENVKELRQAILTLAVQGKLVRQDPNDEPASILLEKIQKEKEKLIKEGILKKEKPLPPIKEDIIPHELPSGWKWIRLQNVVDIRDGTHDTPRYFHTGIPLITSKNLSNGRLDLSNVNYISKEDHEKIMKRSGVEVNNILFAMIGSIGNPVLIEEKPNFSIKNVALFKYYNDVGIIPKYLFYYLMFAQHAMKENALGGVQAFVSLKFLREYLFPLPPYCEQKSIVEKLDEIMPIFERLEAAIFKCNLVSDRLLNSVINKAFANVS